MILVKVLAACHLLIQGPWPANMFNPFDVTLDFLRGNLIILIEASPFCTFEADTKTSWIFWIIAKYLKWFQASF